MFESKNLQVEDTNDLYVYIFRPFLVTKTIQLYLSLEVNLTAGRALQLNVEYNYLVFCLLESPPATQAVLLSGGHKQLAAIGIESQSVDEAGDGYALD